MKLDPVEDAVMAVVRERAALRESYGYGPASVAYLMDLESSISTSISVADIKRALNRLKHRGVIKYRNRVGWVPVNADATVDRP